MRNLPVILLSLAVVAGCSQPVTGTAAAAPSAVRTDLPPECSEVPMLIGGKLSEISALAEQPKELKAAIGRAALDVEALALGIRNTTVKQAVEGFAEQLKKIKVTDRETAIEATKTAISSGTASMDKVAQACA